MGQFPDAKSIIAAESAGGKSLKDRRNELSQEQLAQQQKVAQIQILAAQIYAGLVANDLTGEACTPLNSVFDSDLIGEPTSATEEQVFAACNPYVVTSLKLAAAFAAPVWGITLQIGNRPSAKQSQEPEKTNVPLV